MEDIEKIFDNPKSYLNWYENHKVIYELEKKLVKSFSLKDCVDLGSGPGIFHDVIDNVVASVDISYKMLNYFKDGEKIVASVTSLPFKNKSFNCSFSSVTVCFVKELNSFFHEMSRITKERAVICFIPLDSTLGKIYDSLGKSGHKYYSKAIFRPYDEIIKEFNKYFNLIDVKSILLKGLDSKDEEILNNRDGSFICIEGKPK